MIRKKTYLMTPFLLALLLAAVFPGSAGGLVNVVKAYRAPGESVRVPVGGNTWRSSGGEKGGRVTNQGIRDWDDGEVVFTTRSEEHTSELQSLMRNSYAVLCLKKKNQMNTKNVLTE